VHLSKIVIGQIVKVTEKLIHDAPPELLDGIYDNFEAGEQAQIHEIDTDSVFIIVGDGKLGGKPTGKCHRIYATDDGNVPQLEPTT
jgi:hypothetical protein